ncbi:MAG: phosphoribosylformylglycinamidine synthase I [Candidatus Levybacteria bacterium]|nr:phosphoribosylformylglycinamidine synthase I [Candidatus Levybacteria bacterium]
MKTKPKVLVLLADGINRDVELKYAFDIAGGNAAIVHINDLRAKKDSFKNYQILAIPGGFAYGDDIASGKILATELTSFFKNELQTFINRKDTLTIGICNGFQALVRTGLLPFGNVGTMSVTLTNNDSGHFECRWVPLKIEKSRCVFLQDMQEKHVLYPVAHGEGKFFTDNKTLKQIEENNLVAFRYIDNASNPTQHYPENPNGALNAIGGVTDTSGRILGLMPHPECFVQTQQHPNWRRTNITKPHGLQIFKNMISYVKKA